MIIRNRVATHSCQLVCGQCCAHRNGAFRRWARGAHLRARPHQWTTAGVHVAQHASGSRPEGARWSQSRAVECAVWRSAAQRRRGLGQCGSHVRTLWSSRAGAHAKHALGRLACSLNVGDAHRTQCRGATSNRAIAFAAFSWSRTRQRSRTQSTRRDANVAHREPASWSSPPRRRRPSCASMSSGAVSGILSDAWN